MFPKDIKFLSNSIKLLLKIVISSIAFGYIIYKIHSTPFQTVSIIKIINPNIFFYLLFFSIINWMLEIYKWKIVIQSLESISFKKAFYETFTSYTYGMITPFNSGNYARKTFFYPHYKKTTILQLNFIKGIYQMVATLIFGLAALPFSNFRFFYEKKISFYFLIFVLLGLILFFILQKKIKNFSKIISFKTHVLLLLTSILRFIAFSFLLYFLLINFSHQSNFITIYATICITYLLSSLLPIFNLLDFFTKGSIALWLLIPLGFSATNILISYFLLWITNHALPAIIGICLQFKKSS